MTAGKLGRTWSRLHPEIEYSVRETPQSAKVQSATANHSPEQPEKVAEYTQRKPGFYAYELTHNGTDHRFYIPEKVLDLFNDEFDYRSVANWQELTHMAVAIFVGLIGGDEVAVTGGVVARKATLIGEIRMRMTLIGHVDALVWLVAS